MTPLKYLTGFNNQHCTESLTGALPEGQNSPQVCPYGLYAEQLSGSAFTMNRANNQRSWLYRILPSVCHSEFTGYKIPLWQSNLTHLPVQNPNQVRWHALEVPAYPVDFIDGQITFVINGQVPLQQGGAVNLFAINKSMQKRCFSNQDAEMLIILQAGELLIKTEFGLLTLSPEEIAVIPRSVKFSVELISVAATGYTAENYGQSFRLPELGLIGANGLANARDFHYPCAWYEENEEEHTIISKFQGHFWQAMTHSSPFNVVAWHGNYAPYKYCLKNFNTMNTVSFDHPDPSIFTVLTSPSSIAGMANLDFVIFPERWMVAEHTFRLPYFHRNVMSEFMGLLKGQYEAKQAGFEPGGASLHNSMSAHGPDADAYAQGITAALQPEHYQNTLAFMLESSYVWQQTDFALTTPLRQKHYLKCWKGLQSKFVR